MVATEDFVRLTGPFRRELLTHCCRMLGSLQDAEDLVQETYVRAWRGFDRFERRSSIRVWLYRIATNVCLTALEHHSRRSLPSGLGGPRDDPERPLPPLTNHDWLQPLPDPQDDRDSDPALIVESRDSVRLALIAAMQHLPAKQRVVLILRDVLAWRAAEVAELLDATPAAVNSLLQRARAQLQRVAPTEEDQSEIAEPALRSLLDQYISAFEEANITALLGVLRDDIALEMPPNLAWFSGRTAVSRFIENHVFTGPGVIRMLRTAANGQPAVAAYWRGPDGLHRPHAVQVLTIVPGGISRIVSFNEPSLVAAFGLPAALEPTSR